MTRRPGGLLLAAAPLLLVATAGCGGPPRAEAAPPAPAPARSAPVSLGAAAVRAPVDAGPGPRTSVTAPPAAAATALPGRAFVPRGLSLPSGRSVTVTTQGTQPDGRLAIPEDPAQVGWWSGGSRPGDPYGSVVMAGHIDSRRYGIGALAELVTAAPGGTLRVSGPDGAATYRITRVTRIAKDRLVPDTDAFGRTGAPRLVLITCGGAFDRRTGHYEDNVVVTAVPA